MDVCGHRHPSAADGKGPENGRHRPLFPGIVTSADAGNHKSESADIYEMAMRRLQSNKRDTVVFEDALHAIRTAKAAGFRVAGVYEATAEQDQPEIQRLCDYYIRSYEELVQSETF